MRQGDLNDFVFSEFNYTFYNRRPYPLGNSYSFNQDWFFNLLVFIFTRKMTKPYTKRTYSFTVEATKEGHKIVKNEFKWWIKDVLTLDRTELVSKVSKVKVEKQ